MLKHIRLAAWGFILLLVFPALLAGQNQNYVYANNDLYSGNNISGFSVLSNGDLGPIAGSPFATGGQGIYGYPYAYSIFSPNRIIVVNNFLYASNAASNDVSAFTIDAVNGALTAIAGAPFATGAFDDSTNSGISLAATPDGKFLYAGSTGAGGQITIFSINSTTGALTMVGTPVSSGGAVSSMKASPDGKFLVIALAQASQIAVFAIQSDGTLQAVANSPFALSSGAATSVDINCASDLLFAGGNSGNLYVFNVASDGQLSSVADSPFATGLPSNWVVALSADDSTLFSSTPGSNIVTAFTVNSDGSLTLPGTSAGAGSGAFNPGGLSVSGDGLFLYAADTAVTGGNGGISTFSLGGGSAISLASLTPTGVSSQSHSVAAYPAKVCAAAPPASVLTAELQVSTSPPPGFDLNATLSLDPSLVVDPLTQPVTLQIGDFSIMVPVGSFKTFQKGVNAGTYLFQGVINSTTLKIQIVSTGQNQFEISAYDKQVDVNGWTDPITVMVGIGGHSGSASVTPIPAELRGNWRGF